MEAIEETIVAVSSSVLQEQPPPPPAKDEEDQKGASTSPREAEEIGKLQRKSCGICNEPKTIV
jgi:hypothetical protein